MNNQPLLYKKEATEKDIQQSLKAVNENQLMSIIEELKKLIQNDEEKAKKILNDDPQLAYAVLEALHALGKINEQTYQQLIGNGQ